MSSCKENWCGNRHVLHTATSASLETTFVWGLLAGKEGLCSVLCSSGSYLQCNQKGMQQDPLQCKPGQYWTFRYPRPSTWGWVHAGREGLGFVPLRSSEVRVRTERNSKNDKIFPRVWALGLVPDEVEESKADFPFGSSSSAAMLSCLLPTRRQKGGFTSTFTKITAQQEDL